MNQWTAGNWQEAVRRKKLAPKKNQVELAKFDDELRHHADMKIALDLNDGAKVNYSKFDNLLTEEKAITGKK